MSGKRKRPSVEEILAFGLDSTFVECSGCTALVLTSTTTPWAAPPPDDEPGDEPSPPVYLLLCEDCVQVVNDAIDRACRALLENDDDREAMLELLAKGAYGGADWGTSERLEGRSHWAFQLERLTQFDRELRIRKELGEFPTSGR
jgi:hypothetical protein